MKSLLVILILLISCSPTRVARTDERPFVSLPRIQMDTPKPRIVSNSKKWQKIIPQIPISEKAGTDERPFVSKSKSKTILNPNKENQIYITKTGIYLLGDLPQGIYQINLEEKATKATIILPFNSSPMVISQERTILIVHGKSYKKWKRSA